MAKKKDMTMTVDEARELVSNPVLWPRIRDFLWDFAPLIHQSRLDGVAGLSGADGISGDPRVKRYILSSLGVEPFFHTFPQDDGSRLALLDGAVAAEIAKWLGALSHAEALRRITSGADVRRLKNSFPGIYPEVFSFTAYFQGMDLSAGDGGDAEDPENIIATGLGLLFSQLDGCPAPVAARFKLKLPAKLCELAAACGAKDPAAAGKAVKKLLKLKFPEAYSLCFS